MIREIRPHTLFSLVRSPSLHERMVQVVLPQLDTPLLLDTAVLLALARVSGARTFFEFGTFQGVQALNLAANLPEDCRVYTLDLGKGDLKQVRQDAHDVPITEAHFRYEDELAFRGSPWEDCITPLIGDSTRFDFSPYREEMDLVFVDGGHDLRTVRSDTENAFDMLRAAPRSCVAWHDYGHPHYPQLATYLDELSESIPIHRVGSTTICFHFRETPAELEPLCAPTPLA